jgi:hypothetical protein
MTTLASTTTLLIGRGLPESARRCPSAPVPAAVSAIAPTTVSFRRDFARSPGRGRRGSRPATTADALSPRLSDVRAPCHAYRWRNYTFAAGAENLFDNVPDRNLVFREGTTTFTAQSNNGMFTYPSQSPFGMNGRFVYTRVTYTF